MYYKELSAKILGSIGQHSAPNKRLRIHQAIVLVITFIVYASFHTSRRPISIVKSVLHRENCTDTEGFNIQNVTECSWPPFDSEEYKDQFSLLESCYLFTYAFCMFGAGYLAERSNLRLFITVALTLSGLLTVSFGLAKIFQIHSMAYFVAVQILSGIVQTSGWPAVVAVVGEWFGSSKKGLIMGLWNFHTSFGNILGTILSGAFVDSNWGFSFIACGSVCFFAAFIVYFFLIPKPSDLGIELENSTDSQESQDTESNKVSNSRSELAAHTREEEAISFLGALKMPGVIEFSLCLFFCKLVSYTFLYWLPLYLKETSNFSSSDAAFASIPFDIGGCIGSMVIGLIADQTNAPGLTSISFLVIAIPCMKIYRDYSAGSRVLNQILQFIAGFFINGPYSLITTAVSANLALQSKSASAMATVSAIIDGMGSIGAAVGPTIAGPLSAGNKWDNVFLLVMISDVFAAIMLARIGLREVQRFRAK